MATILRRIVTPTIGLAAEAVAHHRAKDQSVENGQLDDVQETPEKSDSKALLSEPTCDKPESFKTPSDCAMAVELPSLSSDPPSALAGAKTEIGIESQVNTEYDELEEQTEDAVSQRSGSRVPKGNLFGPASIKDLVNALVNAYPPSNTGSILHNPVIIPQRRPRTQSRGFIRAYAPILEPFGIPDCAWLDFLESFEEFVKITPAFDVVNGAAALLKHFSHLTGDPISTAAAVALTVAIETTNQIYGRIRTNSFLAEINEQFFRPRGLYCLIMTYNPRSRAVSQPFNLASTLAKGTAPRKSHVRAYMKQNLGGVGFHGDTNGTMELLEAASLTLPNSSTGSTTEGAENKPNRIQRTVDFVENYFDKRAQAEFAIRNEGCSLASQPNFESSHGGVGLTIGLNSRGGPIGAPVSRVIERVSGGQRKGRDANPFIMAGRLFAKNVLYLTVTRYPTDEELRAARENIVVEQLSSQSAA